ncbi:MAG: hypothetical protein V4611_01915 [Patescibacteria group bacterium]
MEFTYKYVAQSSGVYGSDSYGTQTYSCTDGDVACQTTQAPNTGFFSASNTPILVTGFVAVVLVATVITYAILRKTKKQKS